MRQMKLLTFGQVAIEPCRIRIFARRQINVLQGETGEESDIY